MGDKLTAIKIKHPDGTLSNQILISALAENVKYDKTRNLVDILNLLKNEINQISDPVVSEQARSWQGQVTGIRVGYDGTNYANAGEAVREQISNLANSIIQADSTLTISGAAADSKTTGDKIDNIDNVLFVNNNWINGIESTIQQGNITTAGLNGPSTHSDFGKRLRSKDFMFGCNSIIFDCDCDTPIQYGVGFYEKPSYEVERVGSSVWTNPGQAVAIRSDAPYIRITIKKTSNAQITPEELTNISIKTFNLPNLYNLVNDLDNNLTETEQQITADSEKVEKEFKDLKNTIKTNQYILLPDILNWRQGTLSATDGSYQSSSARVYSTRFIGISDIVVNFAECALMCYNNNLQLLGNMGEFSQSFTAEQIKSLYPEAVYCRIILRYLNDSNITPQDAENIDLKIYSPISFYDRFFNYEKGGEFLNKEFAVGGFSKTGINSTASNRLRSIGYVKVKPNTVYTLKVTSNVAGKQILPSASLYTTNDYSTARIRGSGFGCDGEASFITTSNTKYVRFLFAFDDDSEMTINSTSSPDSISSVTLTQVDVFYANYFIDSSFMKHKVMPVYLGNLLALQSFFKYGDYYYSTQGSTFYKQDLNFNTISQKSLSLGHGNSMHLGTNNNAFASGWNNQKIYEIDIASEEIINTIDLPTTGYTSCAVDDINKIAYIFQRDGSTTPPGNWNFISYNYQNNEILLTKITRPFGAIQGVDFVNGKIFALSGMGNDENPNYFCVYNTQGDIIGEYILNQFNNSEPEGVCVDRSDGSVYISFSNKNLYRLLSV